MADIDDLFTHPNAGAYEREESRTGPPLDYVGEKTRNSLEHAWRLARHLRSGELPEDVVAEIGVDAEAAYKYGLTAYLALYNMLGMLADHRKADALLELDDEAFDVWLDTVQRDGSVRG